MVGQCFHSLSIIGVNIIETSEGIRIEGKNQILPTKHSDKDQILKGSCKENEFESRH